MKKLVSFLIITLLLFSCMIESHSNGRKNFSKRKHLKGHFWNPKKGFGKTNKKDFEQNLVFTEENVETEENNATYSSNYPEVQNEDLNVSSSIDSNLPIDESESLDIVLEHNVDVELDDTIKVQDSIPQHDDWEMYDTRGPRCGLGFPFAFVALMVYTGLLMLLVYFILAAFDIVLKWLLITGIIMAGLPIAIALLIIVLAVIFF